jgi:hypothetical protein
MKRPLLRAVVAYSVLSSVFFVGKSLAPPAWLASAVPPRLVDFLGFLGMLAPLTLGAADAAGIVRRLERGNRARPAWMLLAGWLGAFAAGEAVLGVYRYVAFTEPPTPSAGDALFLLGYAMLIASAAWFVRVYASSGFPLGPRAQTWGVAAGTTAALLAIGGPVLAPIVRLHRPGAEALVALAYPVLDFAVLVPSAVLLAITLRFRGGRVWAVWAFILSGFVVLSVADVLFAYFDLAGAAWVDPLLSATFIAGYSLTAVGVATQRSIVQD